MHHASAVLGEEQVFDVELDRHTELLPAREDVKAPSWDTIESATLAEMKSVVSETTTDIEPRMLQYATKRSQCIHNRYRSAHHEA